MGASVLGILTLCALVLAGPLAFLIAGLLRRKPKRSKKDGMLQAEGAVAEGREEVSSAAYLLGLLGWAIGIGNLWRFPYLVGKWGGGAFILAYLVCLFLVSIPAYLFEVVLGQYTRKSTIDCFEMIHPRWKGLGYLQAIMVFLGLGYYNVVLAWSIYYLAGSLFDPLPWAGDSANYWTHDVLNSYEGNYEGVGLGPVQWKMALALLFVWLVVWSSIAFGKEILAKVTWVTVIGPVVLLVVLLVRVLPLDGAMDGIKFYICKFDAQVLGNLDMWATACGQILFSLSPGFGTTITMSSYTNPRENVFKACLITALCNSTFSIVGGFAMFSIVGNITYRINAGGGVMDQETGLMMPTTVKDQAKAGPGLAFIALADGMQTFGYFTNVMSVLFFLMLFTLGLDSTYAWAETFISIVEDFCEKHSYRVPRSAIVTCVCVVLYFCGLLYCTRMGLEMLDIVDHYSTSYFLLLGVGLEGIMFTFDFGFQRLAMHVKRSTHGTPSTPHGQDVVPLWFWKFAMAITVPAGCFALFIYLLVSDLVKPYESYPGWLQAVGWTLVCVMTGVTVLGGILAASGKRASSRLPPLQQDEIAYTQAIGHSWSDDSSDDSSSE